ncbi:DUF1259 domain-containing protein [Terrilactibacillus sp. BCM23-1]|uniref:DUF1259 domain-containing protein n=1 Tax=Terrilactibacillus tamarindi TaxID=2599694 RepID=A0A6N8CMW2_9BACI|nr:DUF1259 domain-containing protein [Terrilactibacillus tamarindi]MTT31429.1 DUF1259 domain-containing protein [Terrilactibacillus tamarindi]
MERRDVFDNWFRFVNHDTNTNFFENNQVEAEFKSSSKSIRHHSNSTGNNEMDFELESSGHGSRRRRTHSSHGDVRDISTSKCQRLADIIGGMVISATPVCVVMRLRDINATILGRRTRSPLALPFMLSFENNGLNLGETVLLQKEVNPMIDALRRRGIIVTAFHNHWLFEKPRLMYMHWENVDMSAEEFARNSIEAAREAGLF